MRRGELCRCYPAPGPPPAAEQREVEPLSLADADSLFMQIDGLLVHYKLCVNGVNIMGRDAERQARQAVTQALEEAAQAAASEKASRTTSHGHTAGDALHHAAAQGEEVAQQRRFSSASTSSTYAAAAAAGSCLPVSLCPLWIARSP